MDKIKEYINIIIYISIAIVIIEMITPETKLKKYVITLTSLLIIILIASPIVDIFKNRSFNEISQNIIDTLSTKYEETKISYDSENISKYENKKINNKVKQSLEEDLKTYIMNKYKNINVKNVNCKLNDDYMILEIEININSTNNMENRLMFISNLINDLKTEYKISENIFKISVED